MLIDPVAKSISFRQSWLDTAFSCAERGRLDIVAPAREEGDAAWCGTSVHAAVEQFLIGKITLDEMEEYARSFAFNGTTNGVLQDDGSLLPISYKSFGGEDELLFHAGNCTKGWVQDIYPVLVANDLLDGQAEVKFQFDAFEYRDWVIGFQGMCDWVPDRGNLIWDWKTSGRDYLQKSKQKEAVQPTVYTLAAINGCFGREFAWPIEFHYGIALRLKTKARGQIVTVERRQGHADWLYRRVKTFVDLFLDVGLDRPWSMTDNWALCSERWCPQYGDCRGKNISREMDLFGWAG